MTPPVADAAPAAARGHLDGYADILTTALTRLCGELPAAVLATLLARVVLTRVRVGDILYRQGEEGWNMHIVLTGRLQVRVEQADGGERVVAHPRTGDAVGEMAMFSGGRRAATVMAVRDSTLGVIGRADIDDLVARQPQVFSSVTRMIIDRLTGGEHPDGRRAARTLMLVPLHPGAASAGFCRQLRQALLRFGSVRHLDAAAARHHAGDDPGRFLDACESSHDHVLLEAETAPGPWTRVCYGYADHIVLLADATLDPGLTELERWLFTAAGAGASFAEVDLVLMHPANATPAGTRRWLAPRRQVTRHHHVRAGESADSARVARFLSGNAVALVLAGGGARGFAHLGVIRALHEAGVPIDAVGGTSFGALAATGLARGLGDAEALGEHQVAFSRNDPLGDYTIPIVSLVRGEHLNRVLQERLPMDIEDLWLPFFAVSSDLSANRTRVHDQGPLWRAIRASVSLPAILPPLLEDGHLLIDGGVLNNLPVDVMRERVRGSIIAVDLAVEPTRDARHTEIPSGMDYIKSRLLPGRQPIEAPTVSRVILQVTTLASRKEVQSARKLADLYLNPPIGAYDFLDWGHMREIADIGYRHSLPRIRDWLREQPRREHRASHVVAWRRGKAA